MSRPSKTDFRFGSSRLIAAAVALCVVFGFDRAVDASSRASAAHSLHDGDSPACKCGMRCRPKSCCCDSEESPGPATKSSIPPAPDGRPCLSSAPCGGAEMPTPSPGGVSIRKAALATELAPPADELSAGRTPLPTSPRLPAKSVSRTEEPPEFVAV